MKRAQANAVYDVLVEHCGVKEGEYDREDFVHAHRDDNEFPCREYRFMGSPTSETPSPPPPTSATTRTVPRNRNARDHYSKDTEQMGNIGEPVKTVEFEPMPETVPVVEPAAPAPSEPEKVPA